MSGHNKWSQIKYKKAKEDAKKGQAFTKLIKEITVAARSGGGDSTMNAVLRNLLEKAKEVNMPLENATRAIKRGTGELPGVHYEAFTYEGYGPFGIAVLIDTLSDNKNRTVAELRRIFTSKSGNLGEHGSVSWMFEHMGVIKARNGNFTEDNLLDILMAYDVKDIRHDGNIFSIYCDIKSLEAIKQALKSAGLHIESAELEWVPKNTVSLPDDQSNKALEFLSVLQDHEDVQNVYTNLA